MTLSNNSNSLPPPNISCSSPESDELELSPSFLSFFLASTTDLTTLPSTFSILSPMKDELLEDLQELLREVRAVGLAVEICEHFEVSTDLEPNNDCFRQLFLKGGLEMLDERGNWCKLITSLFRNRTFETEFRIGFPSISLTSKAFIVGCFDIFEAEDSGWDSMRELLFRMLFLCRALQTIETLGSIFSASGSIKSFSC